MRTIAMVLACFFAASTARGADIAVALTDSVVEVDASFSGARLVLFGALSGADADLLRPLDYDLVAVVRGPASDFVVRPIERRGLIWLRGEKTILEDAPALLLTSSTRPLDEFATPALQEDLKLTAESLDIAARARGQTDAAPLVEAFLRAGRADGRFEEEVGAVAIRKGSLFAIDIDLPPTTPVGSYLVEVFLIRASEVVSRDQASIIVSRVGLERRIYELAHSQPFAYGLFCVVIAVSAGWLAAAAFRR